MKAALFELKYTTKVPLRYFPRCPLPHCLVESDKIERVSFGHFNCTRIREREKEVHLLMLGTAIFMQLQISTKPI